jgi:hypothetical protein
VQTIGQPTAPPESSPRKLLGPVAVLVAAVALAGAVLGLARSGALPADPTRWTPQQVAEEFNARYEAGEVAAFHALLSPDAVLCLNEDCSEQVPFGTDIYNAPFVTAHESQYLAATGGTLGAECRVDGPWVECAWHQSNLLYEAGGIDPSVDTQTFKVENGRITEYTPGYRWSGVMHDDRVQQNQYSEWVRLTHPDEHAGLFEGQLMLVFSEENQARHRQLITEWMTR